MKVKTMRTFEKIDKIDNLEYLAQKFSNSKSVMFCNFPLPEGVGKFAVYEGATNAGKMWNYCSTTCLKEYYNAWKENGPFIFHRDSATAHKAIFTNTSLGIRKTQKLSESDA